ncbi:MAG TPA: MOSC domain-containing protein [Bacillales bacterium]|nr:MOSC domain-containing protein [Bacillales bacterium]
MNAIFQIVSLNAGKPVPATFNNKEVRTAIYKQPIDDAVPLSKVNLSGDAQGNLKVHGGPDKALCAYAYDHYGYWENELDRQLNPATFGENLTIQGLTEDHVHIGDTFEFGEALVQVTQPRQPCFKLAGKLNRPDMIMKVRENGFSGYYFRVLNEGMVSRAAGLKRISIHPKKVSITFVNKVLYQDQWNERAIRTILEVDELADSLRDSFEKRLDKTRSEK